jgi:prolyl oligopeptidase
MFSFSSFSRPDSLFKLDLGNYKTEAVFMQKQGNYDYNFDDYTTDQVFYHSKDGTQVPMFITRKKSTLQNLAQAPEKPVPVMLYGYGGFAQSV